MKRRTAVIAGVVLLSLLAGLTWYQSESCGVPSDMHVDSHYSRSDVLSQAASAERGGLEPDGERQTVVTSERDGRRTLENGTEAAAFALETNFTNSYVLVVQTQSSSRTSLEPRCIRRTEDGTFVRVALTKQSGPRTSDIATHSLVLRITDDRAAAPDNVTVGVASHDVTPVFPFGYVGVTG